MKTKLLKRLRRNAYVERRNNGYRAILKARTGGCRVEFASYWASTEEEAKSQLINEILFVATYHHKVGKEKIYYNKS